MTLERAHPLLQTQVAFGGGYNRPGARLILLSVAREHGQQAADGLIRALAPERVFGLVPGAPLAAKNP